ncbi:Carboxypeptidase A2 [Folsomia candida]|uniref:Zinc carboxypeptidase A 1 n=1 Tax=Folsomia candida TaxID=158441 RepID=A0A226EXV8_FOLCA|nr:Carboxypeptidase A2 [Folsomia candida]
MKFLLLLSVAFLAFVHAKEMGTRTYKGYQVFTVKVTNPAQFEVVKSLYDSDEYDFWTTPRKLGATDIMAAPEQIKQLGKIFAENGMQFVVKVKDVGNLILEEQASNKRSSDGRISWTAYPSFAEIRDWLTSIDSPIAEVSTIGYTHENRPIFVVKFSTGGAPKKSILIDANIHAREWIAGATATWIINELVTNPDPYADILAQVDIYIIPMVNADGFEWSRARDRMWRKTRSIRSGSSCIGCDPNRNFAFMFGGEGTSPDPCSNTYTGAGPFSEPETAAIRDFVVARESEGVKFYAYMTFHSYSQLWLLPWGYTQGVYPPDYAEQLSLGQASIAALEAVHGTAYQTGQGADILYGVGGASDDWAKDHGIKYTATIEMRDTEEGYGFILPADQIIPNAEGMAS